MNAKREIIFFHRQVRKMICPLLELNIGPLVPKMDAGTGDMLLFDNNILFCIPFPDAISLESVGRFVD